MRLLYITFLVALFAGGIIAGFANIASAEQEQMPWFVYGPMIDRITMPVMTDYNMRLLAFEAKELDLFGVLARDLKRVQTNRPDAHIFTTVGITSLGSLHFNVQNWPVNYTEVRKAFAHLFNRDYIIQNSPLAGIAVKNPTYPPPTHGVWVNWNADMEKLYPYNPDKAREYLSKVFQPCPDDPKWWCDPRVGGKRVVVELLSLPEATSPTYWWIAQYLKTEAEKVGIQVNIVPVSSRELDARTTAGTAVAWIIGWSFGRFPTFMWWFFHSSNIETGWNEWRVSNSTLDEILDKFYFAETIDEAIKWAHKAQELLVDIIPWVPCYTGVGITALDGRIDRNSIVLAYAPPMKDPVGFSYFWWNTVRFADRPFGGTLRYYFTIDITTLHPATYMWASEADAIFRVYYWTMVTDPSDIYKEPRIPTLLKNYVFEREQLPNGTTLYKMTLVLREGIKWHDGGEMTVDDIIYTWQKFGLELRTRRFWDPMLLDIVDITKINKTAMAVTLKRWSWIYLYSLTETIALPKHVFEKLPDPLKDPSLIPHPTVPGLTAMVGNGPFALIKRDVAYAELVWFPEFIWRHPNRTVQFASVDIPASVDEGKPFTAKVTLTDYTGSPAENASVTLVVSGPTTFTFTGRHLGGGVFQIDVPGLPAGTYTVKIEASQPIMLWKLTNSYTATLTVRGAGPTVTTPLPTAGPAPVTISIEKPSVSPVSPATPPKVETVAVSPTTSTAALGISVIAIALALVSTVRRGR